MAKLVKVRIGPSNYLKMTEDDAKAYVKEHGAYGEQDAAPEPEAEAKAVEEPAENKAKAAPVESKRRSRKQS